MNFKKLVAYERIEAILKDLSSVIDNINTNDNEKYIVMNETYNYVKETMQDMKKLYCYDDRINKTGKNNIDRVLAGYEYFYSNKTENKNKIISKIILLLENCKRDIDIDLKIVAAKIFDDMQ